jgi:hypothetical protein
LDPESCPERFPKQHKRQAKIKPEDFVSFALFSNNPGVV